MTGEQQQRRRAEIAEARPGWYWWAVMVVTAVAGPGVAIYVSASSQHRSEQAQCDVITLWGEDARTAAAAAPGDPRAARAVAAVERLRKAYGCPIGN